MKRIRIQVTYSELCWILEGLDGLLKFYEKQSNIEEIEKTRAHVIRKMCTMERRERGVDNDKQ